jgi:hypothetical protein
MAKLYSIEYYSEGVLYAMHIYGTYLEVISHAARLKINDIAEVEGIYDNARAI